jgi:hypothetical protein
MDDVTDPLYVVPNQTNILDQIADLEADQIDEDVRYAENDDISLEAIDFHNAAVEYTDPVGNTFEAIVVEESKPKLSLDDILIRIPNEEKTNLSPFEKMQQRLEEANARSEAEAEEVEKEWEEETNISSSLALTPKETVEYQDELDEYQATEEELETLQEKLEAREVKAIAVEILKEESDFDFDLGGDTTENKTEEANDFDFF